MTGLSYPRPLAHQMANLLMRRTNGKIKKDYADACMEEACHRGSGRTKLPTSDGDRCSQLLPRTTTP